MALVSLGFRLNVTLVDNGDDTSTLRYELASADYATAVTDTASILAALDDITNAVVKGYTLVEQYIENALTLPGAGVHVEDRAKLVCGIDGEPLKTVTLYVPAPVIGLFTAGSGKGANIIDVSDPDLLVYIGLFETTGGVAYVSDGETMPDTGALKEGNRVHRQSSFG